MQRVSILNDVMGPIMRGPSSSHTAGSYRIGLIVRSLLGEEPRVISMTIDPNGSFAPTLEQLGVDIAFVAGVMGWSMMDDDYTKAIEKAKRRGVQVEFLTVRVTHSDHPNAVWIEAEAKDGTALVAGAESIGGGTIRFTHVDGWPLMLSGESYEILVETDTNAALEVEPVLTDLSLLTDLRREKRGDSVLLHTQCGSPLPPETAIRIQHVDGVKRVRCIAPFCHIKSGRELFSNASEMISAAKREKKSLGQVALGYEAELLGISEGAVLDEVHKRLSVMKESVRFGLKDDQADMLLLNPTANRIFESERKQQLAIGGIHTRAAARAIAVMHAGNSRAVVCAAPTGGSAGVIPGVLASLTEERGLEEEDEALALLAAGAIGFVVAKRATFAAETAGCQVEIGAAGAMAAAAVVEVACGSALQACDAAAVALQNTLGSVCDPVHGACEIPCHTRNAVAASSAFVCADIVLGGYENAIPLDETIDASFEVGKTLPRELRCTAAGGLATTPSALSMKRLR